MESIWLKNFVLWMVGLGGGFLVAGGVIALIVGLGIVTRFTGITHTALHSRLYETVILFGALFGIALSVYQVRIPAGRIGLAVQGFSAGMYVGGWIMALAEVVNMFPIFSRRIGLTKGSSHIVVSIAIGKIIGSLLQFFMSW